MPAPPAGLLTRTELEARERALLAPYAVLAAESRGRVHPESEHPLRTAFQRDKDRIVHSTAFRRLELKTQVFVTHQWGQYRTRLTHSLEVAQISRTMARALALNEDLTEAIALAHDLGHTPFGHAGEEVLCELLSRYGRRFEHNAQSLRVVDLLEKKYLDFPGLNLTYEVREALEKHKSPYDNVGVADQPAGHLHLEGQLVDLADQIAYNNHDVDDGIAHGLVEAEELEAVPLWAEVLSELRQNYESRSVKMHIREAVRRLINLLVTDAIRETARNLATRGIASLSEVRACETRLVRFSLEMEVKNRQLRSFLFERLYRHPTVTADIEAGKRIVAELFLLFLEAPERLPEHIRYWLEGREDDREARLDVVTDYVAGMTDRYATQEHARLLGRRD
ncbi:deoxyguanosinetriphosphate triphosphohydrolase [bacterium]|nr:deoxyguanosinetriphosphate triphosphohydrolase [bacterium]